MTEPQNALIIRTRIEIQCFTFVAREIRNITSGMVLNVSQLTLFERRRRRRGKGGGGGR